MISTGTHVGQFWVGGRPGNRVFGQLTAGPGMRPVLEVYGSLMETMQSRPGATPGTTISTPIPPWDVPLVTIYGELFAANERVSLMDSQLESESRRYAGRVNDPGSQRFKAHIGFLGASHVRDLSELFDCVRVRLMHLDEWASLPGFSYLRSREERLDQVSHQFPDPQSAPIPTGGRVDFDPQVRVSGPNASGVAMTRTCSLRVELDNAQPWQLIDRATLTPLSSLLALATGKRCNLLAVQVRKQDGNWLDYLGPALKDSSDAAPNRTMLAPYGVLTLDQVATWLGRVDALGPLPPVVADSVAGSRTALETQVLDLCAVAEGLHRRLYPDDVLLTLEAADQARNVAREAVKGLGEPTARAVSSALQHLGQLSYPNRLSALAGIAEEAAPGVTGRTNRWKTAVVTARNTFAHRTATGFLSDGDIDQYIGVIISLQWVLRIVLLRQTGLAAETLRAQVADHDSFRLFIEQARGWLPRVYADRM
jgi:hypothetical protein